MKANNLFLAGVAALSLGMTACNNEDVPQVNNPGEGTTFAGMYISSMKDVSTRAVNDKQEDYGGRTEESKLTELQLLSNVLPQTCIKAESVLVELLCRLEINQIRLCVQRLQIKEIVCAGRKCDSTGTSCYIYQFFHTQLKFISYKVIFTPNDQVRLNG